MQLATIDWVILAATLAVCFAPALFFGRRAGKSTSEFFASGRSVPWWLAGLSMVAEIDRALEAHELIKVKIGEGDRDTRRDHAETMAARTGAAVVQSVGRVLVLWRPRPE